MTATAIQTSYAGHRFRSRLEARWAVFFTKAGIPWEYEPEGFVIDGRPYLPDFLLPASGTWVEVKGARPSPLELDFLLTAGQELPCRKSDEEGGRQGLVLVGPIPELPPPMDTCGICRNFSWAMASRSHAWRGVTFDGGSFLQVQGHGLHDDPPFHKLDHYMWPETANAYLAARSARFEYGEKP